MTHKSFLEIEEMFKMYELYKAKLSILKPRITQILSFAPGGGGTESKVEKMACERAEISTQIEIIERCLGCMTHDERLFIHYRYISDKDIDTVAMLMNWSRSEIYRLRKSVLSKTRWLLGLPETNFTRKTS